MLYRVGTLLGSLAGTGEVSSIALSLAAALAEGEAEAFAIDFTDTFYQASTGFYGSAYILDTGTPANDYDTSPVTSAASLLTYTAPSLKMTRQADGLLKFQAHNLCLQSENLTATWQVSSATVTANTTTATASAGAVFQAVTTVSGATYCVKVRATRVNNDWLRVRFFAGSDAATAWFDLQNGVVGSYGVGAGGIYVSHSITDAGGGAYDCELVCRATSTSQTFLIAAANANSGTTSDIGDSVQLTRMQVSRLPSPSTYLATTTAARYDLPYEWDADGNLEGILVEEARTNLCLYSDDLTNAAWVKTNATAAKTATGRDGVANSASTLTATAANGVGLQLTTSTSAARSLGVYIKRRTGTGAVSVAVGEATGSDLITDVGAAFGARNVNTTVDSETATTITLSSVGAGTYGTNAPGITATVGKLYRIKLTATSSQTRAASVAFGGVTLSTAFTTLTATVPLTIDRVFQAPASGALQVDIFISASGAGETLTVTDMELFEVAETTVDLSSGEWVRATIENKTLTNPCLGIKLATSGDAVDVALAGIETGAFATSPIPTLASTVTRAVDNISLATTAFPHNAAAGTLFMEFSDVKSSATYLSLSNNSANERILLFFDPIYMAVTAGGVLQAQPYTTGSVINASVNKAAGAFTQDSFNAASNGVLGTEDTSGTMPTVTTLRLGPTNATPTTSLRYRKIMYLPRRMSNADMQTLTT
jgi:hypothetical protein